MTSQSHQALVQDLTLLLRARYPLLYILSAEEEPVLEILWELAQQSTPKRGVFSWDIARGWSDTGKDRGSVMSALSHIAGVAPENGALFVLRDLHPILKHPHSDKNFPVVRELRNLVEELKKSRNILILLSQTLSLPDELREEATVIDFPLPKSDEINELMKQLVGDDQFQLEGIAREELVRACQGLSRTRIRRVLAKTLAAAGTVDETAIASVLEEKKQVIRQTGILEFYPASETLQNVGGLENLKAWVRQRKNGFSDAARQYGLATPRGLLLAGIQGTGKSLSAKTIASEWRQPLLRLDVGRLFGGIVGESENRMRQMIQIAEAIAPCVLWIDEIDKAFGNITSGPDGDSGASRRVFGSLITWMAEKTSPVFIVATANDMKVLPAELVRKGRVDEIFFLNLPTQRERQEIFQLHLQRVRTRWREFDLEKLASASPEFSGAEIEQVIADGMYQAFSRNPSEDFTTHDILNAIQETVPLARIKHDQVETLKRWAAKNGARQASVDDQLESELTELRPDLLAPESKRLEVD